MNEKQQKEWDDLRQDVRNLTALINHNFSLLSNIQSFVQDSHRRILSLEEKLAQEQEGVCRFMRRWAHDHGGKEIGLLWEDFCQANGHAYNKGTFYCQVGDYLKTGRVDTTAH